MAEAYRAVGGRVDGPQATVIDQISTRAAQWLANELEKAYWTGKLVGTQEAEERALNVLGGATKGWTE